MLTYTETKTVNRPRLVIEYDQDAESPREWSNLGYFFTRQSNYRSPDSKDNTLYQIMLDTENEANNCEHHMKLIKQEAKKQGIIVKAIYPVYCYEHGNIVYKRGEAHGFDYSNCGFYIVTDETAKEVGTKPKDFVKVIDTELETYNKWANGEVYRFELYDSVGNQIDNCGGFYSLEEIKEQLGQEWKDENMQEYLNF